MIPSYERPVLTPIPFSWHLSRLQEVRSRLQAFGLSFPASSRFATYYEMLTRFVAIGEEGKSSSPDMEFLSRQLSKFDLGILHRGLLEIEELRLIVTELPKQIAPAIWVPRVREILAGMTVPRQDANPMARDKQFELYLAALCILASFGVELREPDVVVTASTIRFGIAAKRPSSSRQVDNRIRHAAKQIRDAGLDGIIAIDLSLVENPEDGLIEYNDPAHLLPPVEQYVEHWVQSKIVDRRRQLRLPANAIGVLVRLGILARGSMPQLGSSTRLQISNLCHTTDPRFGSLQEFAILLVQAAAEDAAIFSATSGAT